MIGETLGAQTPIPPYSPYIGSTTRSKLSKHAGTLAIAEYRNRGICRKLNMQLALLGWSRNQENFADELVFDIGRVQHWRGL